KTRHLLERDGYVVELAAICQGDHFAANEKSPMAIASAGSAFDLRQCRCRHEADELEVRRSRVHRLQLGKQSARGGTSSADIDAAARPDRRQSPLHRNKLRAEISSTQTTPARRAATRCHATPPVNLSCPLRIHSTRTDISCLEGCSKRGI